VSAVHAPVATCCPACGRSRLDVFYEQDGVPVASNRLFRTRAEAAACPRGRIRLAWCEDCGMIANLAFVEPEWSAECETSQAASSRFRLYAQALASQWIERYGLRGRAVLEIGCGRGEFLEWMCEAGAGRGIGVDPVLALPRCGPPTAAPIEWVAERYRGEHLASDVRAVVCRHTLEHVADGGAFVRALRDSIGEREDVVVLFEVPDALRVLREAAFWDVYYEHCAYFSAGSLARLFERSGFEVVALRRVYDAQYLVLEARPARGGSANTACTAPDDRDELRAAVEHFRAEASRRLGELQGAFAAIEASGERVALWGAGSKATAYLSGLGLGAQVHCVVDINPRKQGSFIAGSGHPVVAPAALRDCRPDLVVPMNAVYRGEIAETLRALGVHARLM
jgi:hypothetical protein